VHNKVYIGKTSRPLAARCSEHKSAILNNPLTIQKVHYHFKKSTCSFDNFRILPIALTSAQKLGSLEKLYIHKFKPHFNIKDKKYKRVGDGYVISST
jgi:hypothetical protein